MNNISIEILEYSYWEHFKALKDISLTLSIDHPKRKNLEKSTSEILKKLNELKNEQYNNS